MGLERAAREKDLTVSLFKDCLWRSYASVAGALLVGSVMAFAALSLPASAGRPADDFARTLQGSERGQFEAWYRSQIFFDASMDAYWDQVESKRRGRRAKRRSRQAFTDQDYVTELPPEYAGPTISSALRQRWGRFRDRDKPKSTPGERKGLPGLDVYLASAERYFGFRPERIAEREFKRRYAREALSYGLTKDQVVRVYALETGGRGTADMQAGIHPIKKTGRPISSALGYAQLLAANSINVLSKHGHTFIARMQEDVNRTRDATRRRQLENKLSVLRRMVATAKSVPYKWSRHVAFARTSKGRALHVMNMDGDVGPWMQVVKLADLKKMAERRGLPNLSGEQIELMNLAGPATGLEMMAETGLNKPTSNFFSRRAYYRNTVVRGKDSRGLLVALDRRMQAGLKNDGAKEFLAVFDELLGVRKRASRDEGEIKPFGFAPFAFQSQN